MHVWTELNLAQLTHNIQWLQRVLPPSRAIFVVKSNAYGHGVEPVARTAWAAGVRWFAVVHAHEARALRALLPSARILLLGVLPSAQAAWAARQRLDAVVVDRAHALGLAEALKKDGARERLRCHVKLDTGMGRLGLPWRRSAAALADLADRPELEWTGICSHLATAGGSDLSFSAVQVERFSAAVRQCRAIGLPVPFRHISNSGGIAHESAWDFEGVRAGLLLYGYARPPADGDERPPPVRPCLQWHTRVAQVRSAPAGVAVGYDGTYSPPVATRLATLHAGYADGLPRCLGNRGFVLLGGRRCPIVGRVSMNLTLVEVGAESTVRAGDKATLLGVQGREAIWADEMAEWAQTISYEILTGIRAGAPRLVETGPNPAPSRAPSA